MILVPGLLWSLDPWTKWDFQASAVHSHTYREGLECEMLAQSFVPELCMVVCYVWLLYPLIYWSPLRVLQCWNVFLVICCPSVVEYQLPLPLEDEIGLHWVVKALFYRTLIALHHLEGTSPTQMTILNISHRSCIIWPIPKVTLSVASWWGSCC